MGAGFDYGLGSRRSGDSPHELLTGGLVIHRSGVAAVRRLAPISVSGEPRGHGLHAINHAIESDLEEPPHHR